MKRLVFGSNQVAHFTGCGIAKRCLEKVLHICNRFALCWACRCSFCTGFNFHFDSVVAEAVVVRPKPVIGRGFRRVWVHPNSQWPISLATGEVVLHIVSDENAAITLHIVSDENGDVVMARKRPFSFKPRAPWP